MDEEGCVLPPPTGARRHHDPLAPPGARVLAPFLTDHARKSPDPPKGTPERRSHASTLAGTRSASRRSPVGAHPVPIGLLTRSVRSRRKPAEKPRNPRSLVDHRDQERVQWLLHVAFPQGLQSHVAQASGRQRRRSAVTRPDALQRLSVAATSFSCRRNTVRLFGAVPGGKGCQPVSLPMVLAPLSAGAKSMHELKAL